VSKFLGFDYDGDESGDEVPMFVSSSPTATFDQVLEALLNELEGSSKIPFSSTVMIQREVVLELIDELRAALPEELRRADRINRDRDAILLAAEESKNQMLATARRESNALVEKQTIVERSKERAREIMADAEAKIRTRTNQANEYIQGELTKYDNYLTKMHGMTLAQREKLRSDPNPFDVEYLEGRAPATSFAAASMNDSDLSVAFLAPEPLSTSFYDPDDL
jgi:hypothetical protein